MSNTKLKPIEKKSGDDFGNLLKMFGAQKNVDSKSTIVDSPSTKSVDQQTTNNDVDFKSAENVVVSKSTKRVDLKSTPKDTRVDSKSTIVDSPSTKSVDQQSTNNDVDFKSADNVVVSESTKRVDLKSTSWFALQTDFYLIGVWQVLFDTFGNEKISDSIRSLAKRFSMDPAQFHRILRKLEAAEMVHVESSKRFTQIEMLTPKV